MPERKCNPCVLCGYVPIAREWNGSPDYFYAAYCYNDLGTHTTQCNGHSRAEAIACWNRLNPLPGETPTRTKRDRFSALLARTFDIREWIRRRKA